MGTNFAFMENEHTRRGSRGSIISGKANITPTETTQCATIPTHHLAKLSLSTSPDYVRLFLLFCVLTWVISILPWTISI